MRRGVEHYKKRDFERARADFASAWALVRHPAIAANLADAETRLGRYRDAAEHWSFYLRNAPPDRDRSDGENGLAECRKHVAQLDVAAEEKSAITVDGQLLGEAPLPAEVWLDPGEHVIEARFANGTTASQRVALSAGDAQRVALVRPPSESPAKKPAASSSAAPIHPASVERQRSPEPATSARTPILVGGAAFTTVALGIGVVYGIKALGASNDADSLSRKIKDQAVAQGHEELATNDAACGGAAVSDDCHALSTKIDTARKARSTAQVAFIAAGILGVGTLATYYLWPRSNSRSASVVFIPWYSAGTSGVTAEGSF